jgi:hypothetical protein
MFHVKLFGPMAAEKLTSPYTSEPFAADGIARKSCNFGDWPLAGSYPYSRVAQFTVAR